MSSNPNDFDYGETLKAKSDQLNADDLIGGPITARITRATKGAMDQPLVLHLEGGHQPWKPCKTMRRLLAAATGSTSTSAVVGRFVTLYRDPTVKWAGKEEGGIRLSHMSGIDRTVRVRLAVSKGKKDTFEVRPLAEPRQEGQATASLDAVLDEAGLTVAHFDAWRRSEDKPPAADLSDDQRAKIAVWLAADASRLDPIRAMADTDTDTEQPEQGEE